jgi:hypothetical protein
VGAVEDGPAAVTTTTSTSSSTTSSTTSSTVPPPCAPTPRSDCRGAAAPHGAVLALRDLDGPARDSLQWSWRSAGPMAGDDFGAPPASTSLTLCLYDANGLRFRTTGEAGSGWTASRTGFSFRRAPSSVLEPVRMSFRARRQRSGRIEVIDRVLSLPALPLTLPVRVQVARDDGGPCWEGLITTAAANTAKRFKGRSD